MEERRKIMPEHSIGGKLADPVDQRRLHARRIMALALACLAAAGVPACGGSGEEPGRKQRGPWNIRHVILLTVDTLRYDALSCYGNKGTHTPNLDRLAADSILFTRARSSAPWTVPSFASMFTGLAVDVHGLWRHNHSLPDNLPTLAQFMRDAGFHTAAGGANPFLKPGNGLSRGFVEHYIDIHKWYEKTGRPAPDPRWLKPEQRTHEKKRIYYTSTPCITGFAIEWLPQNRDRDFFLWVHYLDPHGAYFPPPKYRPKGPIPENVSRAIHNIRARGHIVKEPGHRKLVADFYHGEVRWVDHEVGKIIAMLRKLEIYDEALIVMTSDHGEELWDHGKTEHGHTVYDELLRVPLMVKLPVSAAWNRRSRWSKLWAGIFGIDEGEKYIHAIRDEAVTNRGIMPMILDACGIEGYDKELSTRSLSPFIGLGPGDFKAPPALFAGGPKYGRYRETVVFEGWKYMTVPSTKEEMLFNLKTDPLEQTRLESSRPGKVEHARKLLEAHHKASQAVKSRLAVKETVEFTLDQETLKELEALGYIVE